eukprot:COSAG02_NODE_2806_length_7991_cov_21.891916_2_plen_302_part_00
MILRWKAGCCLWLVFASMPRLFRCLRPGLVRSGPGLDTEPVGELLPGTEIIALDSTTLPSGVQRVQFDAGQPSGWVSRTVSGRGRLARSIPILHDLGEVDALLAAPGPVSLKEKMKLSLLASGEVAPDVVEQTAEEAAASAELKRLAAQGVQGAAEALAELEIGTRVFMSIDEHQAACAQMRAAGDDNGGYEVSDESEDPLEGFSSSDEDDHGDSDGSSCRHSIHHARASGRQSMRMSMTFTPSRPSGSLLTSSDDEGDTAQSKHEVYLSSDDEVCSLSHPAAACHRSLVEVLSYPPLNVP